MKISIPVLLVCGLLGAKVFAATGAGVPADPFSWLHEYRDGHWSERSLEWVKEQNKATAAVIEQDPRFERYRREALEVIVDQGRNGIAFGASPLSVLTWHQGYFYQLRRDEVHQRGMWQRAGRQSYLGGKPVWQDVLDIDALAQAEGKPWLLYVGGTECLGSRCMVGLMDGGDGSRVVSQREFDLDSRKFVAGGFQLSHRDNPVWQDQDTLLIATGDGALVQWRRGQPFSAATEISLAGKDALVEGLWAYDNGMGGRSLVAEARQKGSFDTFDFYEVSGRTAQRMHFPAGGWPVARYRDQWIFQMARDGETLKVGSFASISVADAKRDSRPKPQLIDFSEYGKMPLRIYPTAQGLLLETLEKVRSKLWRVTYEHGHWIRRPLPLPDMGTLFVWSSSAASVALVDYQDFLTAPRLYTVDVGSLKVKTLRRSAPHFNADREVIEQLWAVSRDGTRVPYFLVRPKSLMYDGKAPTLLHGYGANTGPQVPSYDGILGRLWLDKGGVYALANIRGGMDMGAEWFVRKMDRRHVHEDFIAVAEDLIRRKITSPRHLASHGHSMGGNLVGVTLNQRPDLFHAAVMQNGLLDQIDCAVLINGERRNLALDDQVVWQHGSLDVPEERAFLESISPYQNLERREGFPVPLVATTSTDSHSPDMSRRYCAKLQSLGMPCYFYEYEGGGHSMSSTPDQLAHWSALFYTYLAQQVMP